MDRAPESSLDEAREKSVPMVPPRTREGIDRTLESPLNEAREESAPRVPP